MCITIGARDGYVHGGHYIESLCWSSLGGFWCDVSILEKVLVCKHWLTDWLLNILTDWSSDRDQRLEQAKDLSSWSQWRQGTRRTLRRLTEDGFEMLSNLELWRGDIHVIEGKRVVASDKTTCYSNLLLLTSIHDLCQRLSYTNKAQNWICEGQRQSFHRDDVISLMKIGQLKVLLLTCVSSVGSIERYECVDVDLFKIRDGI